MTESFSHLCRLCLEPFTGYCQVRQCPMLGATSSGAVLPAQPLAAHPDATRAVSPVAANPDATRAVGRATAAVQGGDPDATRLPQAHERPLPASAAGGGLGSSAVRPAPATQPLAALPPTPPDDDDGLSTRYVSPPPKAGPGGSKEP